MDYFHYQADELFAEKVALSSVAAQFGTPSYVYSRATLERHWRAFDNAFSEVPHLVCYAVKANSNLAVLNVLAKLDSGFDIVSAGELARVLAAGGLADRTVFSGVGNGPISAFFDGLKNIGLIEYEFETYKSSGGGSWF